MVCTIIIIVVKAFASEKKFNNEKSPNFVSQVNTGGWVGVREGRGCTSKCCSSNRIRLMFVVDRLIVCVGEGMILNYSKFTHVHTHSFSSSHCHCYLGMCLCGPT